MSLSHGNSFGLEAPGKQQCRKYILNFPSLPEKKKKKETKTAMEKMASLHQKKRHILQPGVKAEMTVFTQTLLK